MLVLKCNIQITGAKVIKFDYVSQVEVETSMKTITDTAKLTIPRNLKFHDNNLLEYIKRGDKIKIDLGYDDSGLQTVFKGYITKVSTGRPIAIECEVVYQPQKYKISKQFTTKIRCTKVFEILLSGKK